VQQKLELFLLPFARVALRRPTELGGRIGQIAKPLLCLFRLVNFKRSILLYDTVRYCSTG
jgi:hypothetical protein